MPCLPPQFRDRDYLGNAHPESQSTTLGLTPGSGTSWISRASIADLHVRSAGMVSDAAAVLQQRAALLVARAHSLNVSELDAAGHHTTTGKPCYSGQVHRVLKRLMSSEEGAE